MDHITADACAQELVVGVAAVYNGYVSTNDWNQEKPTAHLFFALADEAAAAALTLQMIARAGACKLHFGSTLQVYDDGGHDLCPRLALRVGVSSHRGVAMEADDETGRLVRACAERFTAPCGLTHVDRPVHLVYNMFHALSGSSKSSRC